MRRNFLPKIPGGLLSFGYGGKNPTDFSRNEIIAKPVVSNLKKTLFILLILNSFFVFSQTKKDSILSELRKESLNSGIAIMRKSDSTKVDFYKLCQGWNDKIKYLKSNITDLEITVFKNDENGTIKFIGLIADLEKNNRKKYAMEIMDDLIVSDKKFLSVGCADAYSTYTVSSFLFHLLTDENLFFKPNFKLTKKEIRVLSNKLLLAEKYY